MLYCPECASKDVYTDLTSYVTLLGKVHFFGPVATKIYESRGMLQRAAFPENCKLVERTIPALTPEIIKGMKFECTNCGRSGNLDRFIIMEVCRCGSPTEKLVWCDHYGIIVCGHCIDPFGCDCCTHEQCESNPKNNGGYKSYFSYIRRST